MFRGGMSGTQGLAGSLESYYQEHGSWQGVESLLSSHGRGRGQGGMGRAWAA